MEEKERAARVAEMEAICNRCAMDTKALLGALETWTKNLSDFQRLMRYYGSEEWEADRTASDAGRLPAGMPCGVLGEDTVYDLYSDMRGASLEMLTAALAWLKAEE